MRSRADAPRAAGPAQRTAATLAAITDRAGSVARMHRLLWFVESSLVLAVVLPTMIVLTVDDVGRSSAWTLTLGIMAWAGIRLSTLIAAGKPQVFEFMFWLFVYIFMGMAPSIQIRTADISVTTKAMPAHIDWSTALVIALSLALFEIGRSLPVFQPGPRQARPPRTVNPRAAWLLFVIGLACMLYYVQALGLDSLFQSREARKEALDATFGDGSGGIIIAALAWVPLMVCTGAFLLLRRLRIDGRRGRAYALAALVSAVGVLLVVNPVSGARYTSGTVLFALLCFTGVLAKDTWIRPLFAGILGAFLFLFPIADAFRRTDINVARGGFFAEYAGNGDYDAFWQVANTLLYIQQEGPTWGRQALGVLFFWAPRSLWTDKPTDTGVLLANFRGYNFTNLSAPLWAEALVNGGLVALVVVFLGLGTFLVRLDRRLPASLADNGVMSLAGSVLPAYMIILLRGSLLQATGLFAIIVLSLLFIGWGRRRASPPRPGTQDGAGTTRPTPTFGRRPGAPRRRDRPMRQGQLRPPHEPRHLRRDPGR